MKTRHPTKSWIAMSDAQFDLVAKRLTDDVPAVDWYRILGGMTQDFHTIYLSAAQVKQVISASTKYEYVHVVYKHCYELWDADVGHGVGNCYWRDFNEMTRPKNKDALYAIYDKASISWSYHCFLPLGECPICLEEMNSRNSWATSCCHNPIHTKCVSKCKDCPLCRGTYYNK
jgi:hypothetical protein